MSDPWTPLEPREWRHGLGPDDTPIIQPEPVPPVSAPPQEVEPARASWWRRAFDLLREAVVPVLAILPGTSKVVILVRAAAAVWVRVVPSAGKEVPVAYSPRVAVGKVARRLAPVMVALVLTHFGPAAQLATFFEVTEAEIVAALTVALSAALMLGVNWVKTKTGWKWL